MFNQVFQIIIAVLELSHCTDLNHRYNSIHHSSGKEILRFDVMTFIVRKVVGLNISPLVALHDDTQSNKHVTPRYLCCGLNFLKLPLCSDYILHHSHFS